MSFLEVSKRLGLPNTTISAHMRYLSAKVKPTRDGYGLVDIRPSVTDRRQNYAVLTAKGRRLLNQMMTLMRIEK